MIGAGRMAEAVISGLLVNNNESIEEIIVSNSTDHQKLLRLQNKYGITPQPNWLDDVSRSDMIVLAMPPDAHPDILNILSKQGPLPFIVTIAAGIDPEYLENRLPEGTPAAWIMPNTAAEVSRSVSLFSCGQYVERTHRSLLTILLSSIGTYEECTPEDIHNLTAVTGSAPAFLYLFAEGLIEAALPHTGDRKTAEKLVIEMIAGSAAMLSKHGSPAQLREQVATPGGATEAGLLELRSAKFEELILSAVTAVNEKAKANAN
ncbi:pyrroline-5-carboxylate reductase [Bacillus lacus]|uniref:Pyrroline-5-carboxylate reductase n=1 Tax=Metabacillus lacus TaxID=1983721 RepID=A0A7X2IWA8_9BACI|nr:pyrroline-5-carboxylate reductase [Metabacillus lacus]MRX70794.1 pyrroline-5-carboxylate reductase [Metabacillus lacus]